MPRSDFARGVAAALALLVAACDDGRRHPDRDAPEAQPTYPSDAASPATSEEVRSAPVRAAPATADRLRAALERLASGAARDSATWFSAQTADVLRSVEVDTAGHAVVDFVDLRPLIPNASSSAGSQMLLAQLNATVFSVDGIASVEYRMAGSCELLGEWLQYGTCLRFDRE